MKNLLLLSTIGSLLGFVFSTPTFADEENLNKMHLGTIGSKGNLHIRATIKKKINLDAGQSSIYFEHTNDGYKSNCNLSIKPQVIFSKIDDGRSFTGVLNSLEFEPHTNNVIVVDFGNIIDESRLFNKISCRMVSSSGVVTLEDLQVVFGDNIKVEIISPLERQSVQVIEEKSTERSL